MSRRSAALRREIEAMEAKLSGRDKSRQGGETPEEAVSTALDNLKQAVKAACGPAYMTYMDEDMDEVMDDAVEVSMEDDMDYMDDEDDMEYMTYMDEDEMVAAEEGVEEDITQEYLSDVLEEERDPATIDTDESMQEVAASYVARLKSASVRLDRVANYLEQQGRKKLAFRIDKIADAIDARIQKEESSDG